MADIDQMNDPAAALQLATFVVLTDALDVPIYSEGAVPTDAPEEYVVISTTTALPEETNTTLTFVTTLVVRGHIEYTGTRASDAPMYALRGRIRDAMTPGSLSLGRRYRLLRLRPPTLNASRYDTDQGGAIDGIVSFQRLRVQELD